MHRIDGPAAAPGGLFTEGDPAIGTPATVVTDDWSNAVQEEIAGVIEGASIALSKPSNGQMFAAIQKLIRLATPVGQVIQGYFPAAPAGFLLCNGALVSRTGYAALWAYVNGEGLAVAEATWAASAWTTFGVGDGATTFRLPELRGEFLRGADLGRGIDAGRALGSRQADALQNIEGQLGLITGGVVFASGAFAADGTAVNHVTSGVAGTDLGLSFDASRVARTAAETRPRNAALAFCVRF